MRKQVSWFLVMALVAAMLAACSPAPAAPAAPASSGGGQTAAQPAASGKSYTLTMGTGSTGGTFYPLGAAIAKVVGDKTNVKVTVQSTGASVENMRLLGKKEVQLGMASSSIVDDAYNGKEMFDTPIKNVRAIGYLYADIIQVFTMADSGINSIADFKGKKIGVGPAGSATEFTSRYVMDTYGLTFNDITPVKAPFDQMGDQFKDRQLAAAIFQLDIPNSTIQDISMTKSLKFLPIDADKLMAKYPYFAKYTMKSGSYKGMTEAVQTIELPSLLVALDSVDTDAVYQLTKAMYEGTKDIAAIYATGAEVNPENAMKGISIPLHPGAEKYFKEKGILK